MLSTKEKQNNTEWTGYRDLTYSKAMRKVQYKNLKLMDLDMMLYSVTYVNGQMVLEVHGYIEVFTSHNRSSIEHKCAMVRHLAEQHGKYALGIQHRPNDLDEQYPVKVWLWEPDGTPVVLDNDEVCYGLEMSWDELRDLKRSIYDLYLELDKDSK